MTNTLLNPLKHLLVIYIIMDPETYKQIANEDDVSSQDGGLVFDPYNSGNKEITLNEVQSILRAYGIDAKVHNLELYKRAFIHRSYTKRPALENEAANITIVPKPDDCMALKTKSNERLEFLYSCFCVSPCLCPIQ